jgi:MFS transporter, BCD family, chlorophyll transporter
MTRAPLGWFGIFRLGLVQTALGAIVVLTTSTINRVMVVEMALPAVLPGALVALHYALQVARPRWGYGSDISGHRTPWIILGMALLAVGGAGAAFATAIMPVSVWLGTGIAMVAFALVGAGVGASGTNLLALLATRVAPERRAAAATIVWMMMIFGFIVTTVTAGHFLDPFSPTRLVAVTSAVSTIAFFMTLIAVWGIEDKAETRQALAAEAASADNSGATKPAFFDALAQVWSEPQARRFTIFVFVSMLAYSMQDLILEPFAGLLFGMTPGQSTKLAGVQHGGVFTGMLLVALACSPRIGFGSLKSWTIGGCVASAWALCGLVGAGLFGPPWPLKESVFLLGVANGAFAIGAIGSMMELAGSGQEKREGVRMGLWGGAQAFGFALGGFTGAALVDLIHKIIPHIGTAYTIVFALEALLFLVAAVLAVRSVTQSSVKPAATLRRTSTFATNPS